MSAPCLTKKVVELREIVKKYDLPNAGKLRTKRALCDAIEQHESNAGEEEAKEESDDDEGNENRSLPMDSTEKPNFSSSSLQHATDQFHWQQDAAESNLNGYQTLNLPQGSTFWHGTSLLFPDDRLPFGVAFYGDIGTARGYAKDRAGYDNHGFARILSAVNVRPIAIVKMNAPNVKRLRSKMDATVDVRPFVPLLDFAFPQSADGKQVSRHSQTSHDAALNYGMQIQMSRLNLDGWCAIDMKSDSSSSGNWHDEICFLHDTKWNPLLERGPEQLFLVPRYPNTLLHFHNGAFCGFIDSRETGTDKKKKLVIERDVTSKSVPESVLGVPEIAHVLNNIAQMDAAYLALDIESRTEAKPVAKATRQNAAASSSSVVAKSKPFIDFDALDAKKVDKNKNKSNPLGLPPPTHGKLIDRGDRIENLRF